MEKDSEKNTAYPYDAASESHMKMFYDNLSEKDKRHYAAVEAAKLPFGGISYIAKLLGCSRSTIHEGMDELKKTTS